MALSKDIIGGEVKLGTKEAQANLTKLSKATSELTNENKALQAQQAKLIVSGKKNSKEYQNATAAIAKNNKAIKSNRTQMNALGKTMGVTQMSANQLRKKASDLRRELNNLVESADPAQFKKLSKELEDVGSQMDKVKVGGAKTGGMFSKLKGAAGGMLPAFGFAAIATGALAAGKAIADMVDKTMKNRQTIQQFTNKTGKDLADLTANVSASAKTFDKDFEEMALATHNFAQSMNISEEAAQSMIDKGFIAGADASGEFLDKVREYGPQFQAAGLSAEQSIAIMTQEVKSGIYSDKGSDAIKESMLRLREMPQTAKDALDGIGISSKEMMAQIASGEITVFEATQKVSRKLGELPASSAAVGTAIADIFGGAGEDAGIEYIKMLGSAELSMDALIAKTGESATLKQQDLEATQALESAWSDLVGTGVGGTAKIRTQIKMLTAKGIQALIKGIQLGSVKIQELRNWFADFYNKSKPLRFFLQYFGFSIKTQVNIAIAAFKGMWTAVKSVGKVIKAVMTGDFKSIGGILKEGFQDAGSAVGEAVEKGKQDWAKLKDNVENSTMEIKPIKVPITAISEDDTDITKTTTPLPAKKVKAAVNTKDAAISHAAFIKAQQQYNAAVNANLEDSLDKQLKLEEAKWAKTKASLEAQLIVKDDLSKEEIATNDLINKTIEVQNQEHLNTLTDLEKVWTDKEKLDKLQAIIDDGAVTLETEMALLDEKHAQGLIKEAEYEEQKTAINNTYSQKRFDNEKKFLEGADQVLGIISNVNSARKNEELRQAGDDEEKREAIEEKFAKKQQKVAIAQALVSGALAIQKIASDVPKIDFGITTALLIGAQIANTAAQVSAIRSQQFATGRYPVIGASDGKQYSTNIVGSPSTGVYSQPSLGLFSETQPEAVIDGRTTQQLLWKYPQIWNGITTMAAGGIPQFADGRYPQSTSSNNTGAASTTTVQDPEMKALMAANLALMQDLKSNGVKSNINALEVREVQDARDSAISASEM